MASITVVSDPTRVILTTSSVPDIIERPAALPLAPPQGRMTFENISYVYPGQRSAALNEVSVDIAPGQLVALVSPSGAGKTTMGNLVLRLYDPDSGTIRLDGHDLRDLKLSGISDAAADVILVLERGRIVERGTHKELREAGGLYARLHALQLLGAR